MKIEKYEALIDGCIEATKIFVWATICGAFTFFSLWFLLYLIIDVWLSSGLNYSLLYRVLPASIIISLPITLFWYFHRKAVNEYDVKRFRDVWMGFATPVSINLSTARSKEEEIDNWIKESIRHMHRRTESNCYIFVSKSDAVAFKLRWL